MRPEMRNAAYLWDMLHAARDASAVVSGLSEQQLRSDRVRMLALERSMELIGEAARRISSKFRENNSQISDKEKPMPWKDVRPMDQRVLFVADYTRSTLRESESGALLFGYFFFGRARESYQLPGCPREN